MMKKKISNNKGSVVLLIVLVIGALSILGTTVLSAALSNYKMRIASSDMKSNIYLTEAGFEEAYAKIYETLEKATQSANLLAKNELAKFDEAFFQQELMLEENGLDSPYLIVNADGEYVYDEDYIKNEITVLTGAKFEEKFIENLKLLVDVSGVFNDASITDETVYIKNKDKQVFGSTLAFDTNGSINDYSDDLLTLYLYSEYRGDTSRNAEVFLDVKVPVYGEPYTVSYNTNLLYVNPLWRKAISTDYDIDVLGGADMNVMGDIYAGHDINAYNSSSLNITGNMVVGNNFRMYGSNDIDMQSAYLKNLLLDGSSIDLDVNFDSSSYAGLYVNDDLEMRNRNQTVDVRIGYYGFNDGSDALYNTSDQSSGIIINSPDISTNSYIRFDDDVYLYGTSYVQLSSGLYQTGESISVKGNYIAYTMPLSYGQYAENRVVFEYKEPLTLVTKMSASGTDLNVYDRSAYFKEYFDEYYVSASNNGGLSLNNIEITHPEKIYSLGKVIYDDKVSNQGGVPLDKTIFDQKKNVHKVYTDVLGDKYISNTLTGIGSSSISVPKISVANDVNFSLVQNQNYNQISAGSLISMITSNTGNDININLNNSTKYMFIVTNGKVNISGNGIFNGCIVAEDGVTVSGNCSFNYNERIVAECFSKFPWLENSFKVHANAQQKSIIISSQLVPPNSTIYTNVDYSSLLDFHSWKIIY